MIHVVAIITAKPGQRSIILEAIGKIVPTVRAEDGCIEYSVTTDVATADPAFGPDTLIVIEKWASPDALKAHAKSAHMAAFGEAVKDARANVAVHRLQDV